MGRIKNYAFCFYPSPCRGTLGLVVLRFFCLLLRIRFPLSDIFVTLTRDCYTKKFLMLKVKIPTKPKPRVDEKNTGVVMIEYTVYRTVCRVELGPA